jgi:hypothetical protein
MRWIECEGEDIGGQQRCLRRVFWGKRGARGLTHGPLAGEVRARTRPLRQLPLRSFAAPLPVGEGVGGEVRASHPLMLSLPTAFSVSCVGLGPDR